MILFIAALFFMLSCKTIDHGEHLRNSDLAGTYHRVKSGDSLDKISQHYRVSKAEIMDINGFLDERIKIGTLIYVPEPDPISTKLAQITKPVKESKKNHASFITPLKGEIVREFSSDKKNPYDGIAIKAPLGAKVKTIMRGRVIFVGNDGNRFGLLVILDHEDPYITVYSQLSKSYVKLGQELEKGEPIGEVGQSGGALFPHLHFQIRLNQIPENPRRFINF